MKANAREYVGKVSDGHLPMDRRKAIEGLFRKLDGKTVKVTIEEYKAKRSNQQSRYYRGVVIPVIVDIFWEAGQPIDEEEAHEFVMVEILKHTRLMVGPDGKQVTIRRSSTEFDVSQWEDRMEIIRAWVAEQGRFIPRPNEPEILY